MLEVLGIITVIIGHSLLILSIAPIIAIQALSCTKEAYVYITVGIWLLANALAVIHSPLRGLSFTIG